MKNRIKECRLHAGMTQEELGKAVGVGGNTINRYDMGYRKPGLVMWERLADALDVIPAYLVGWSDFDKTKKTIDQKKALTGATVYLNDRDATYIELAQLNSADENFVNGKSDTGHKIHIPTHSVLYVEEDLDD